MQIHVVSSGETLFSIARQYDVPAGILARYNGLAEPYRLAVGQSLLILRPTSLVTVRAGDTLSSLARQNGQSVRSLLRLNPNLTQQTAIYPGQIVVTAIEDAPEREAVDIPSHCKVFCAISLIFQGFSAHVQDAGELFALG